MYLVFAERVTSGVDARPKAELAWFSVVRARKAKGCDISDEQLPSGSMRSSMLLAVGLRTVFYTKSGICVCLFV